jgi:hypothetical protein
MIDKRLAPSKFDSLQKHINRIILSHQDCIIHFSVQESDFFCSSDKKLQKCLVRRKEKHEQNNEK